MPPTPISLAWCFCYVFFQTDLLKFVLARWFSDAGSMWRVLQSTLSWGADVVSFGSQDVLLGMHLAPWGPFERSRANFGPKYMFFDMLVSRFLMMSGSESERLGNWSRALRKPTSQTCWAFVDFGVIVLVFFESLGTNFDDFWLRGDGLEILWVLMAVRRRRPKVEGARRGGG